MEQPEFDVWTAPQEALETLYPETRKLIERLRRRQWYYRVIAFLPVLGWGSLLLYALAVDGLRQSPIDWYDVLWMAAVALFMLYAGWSLVGAGIRRRLIGYTLSAGVALIGGIGSCLLGSLLALGAPHAAATPAAAAFSAGLYLLAGVLGAGLSLLAMVHIILLMIVSVRLKALTGLYALRTLYAVRGDIKEEVLARARAVGAKLRPPAAPADTIDPATPATAPIFPAPDSAGESDSAAPPPPAVDAAPPPPPASPPT